MDLSFNEITSFNVLKNLFKLKHLNLSNNKATFISFLSNFHKLETLDISNNPIADIGILEKLSNLKDLSLSGTKLSEPYFLKRFQNLETLDLSNNNISDVDFLSKLPILNYLNLSNNQISKIKYHEVFSHLQVLNLSSNQINNIRFLENLYNLQTINLSNNKIKDLSPLKKMIEYGMDFHEVNITSNPLESPPLSIIRKGRIATLSYFHELKKARRRNESDYVNNILKLVVVGNSTVGKTSLLEFFKIGKFTDNFDSTHWLKSEKWKYNKTIQSSQKGNLLDLEIRFFDFGGQDYYHDTHHFIFSDNTIYLLLWEQKTNIYGSQPTKIRQKSKVIETSLEHYPLKYWLDAIRYYSKPRLNLTLTGGKPTQKLKSMVNVNFQGFTKAPILVVQNKIDISGVCHLNNKKLKLDYPQISDFISISLKQQKRTDYLKYLFEETLSQMEIIGKRLPGHWKILKEKIEHFQIKKIISIDDLTKFCNDILKDEGYDASTFVDKITTQSICAYLHDIGSLLYLPSKMSENEFLDNTIFLDIEWLTSSIYNIFLELDRASQQAHLTKIG